MTTRGDPGCLGVALHLLVDGFDGEGLLRPFAVPKDIALRLRPWMLCQPLLDTGHRIGGHRHAPLLPPLALHHMQGLVVPIEMVQRELGHFRAPQPPAEDHQKQGAVHRMLELGKQTLDLLARERCGQGAPAPHKVTRLARIAADALLVEAKVKKMLERIEPAVDRRPGPAVPMLVRYNLVHLAKGDLRQGDRHLRKEEAQIQRITGDRMRRELPALQVQAKPVYGGLTDVVPALPPLKALALLPLRHRLIVWRPFGPVIQLCIAERDIEGAVAHQLFDAFQGGPSIEQLRGKRMPQRVGRIGLSDACQLQVARHAVADLPGTERQTALARHAAGKDVVRRRGPEPLPLPEGFGDGRRQLDHAIHVAFTVINAQGALGEIDRRPGQAAHFPHAEAAAQQQ
jgi:hypothetical protein